MESLIQGHPAVTEVDEPGLQLKLASREPTLFTTMQPSMDSQELIWFIDWNYIESNIFSTPTTCQALFWALDKADERSLPL